MSLACNFFINLLSVMYYVVRCDGMASNRLLLLAFRVCNLGNSCHSVSVGETALDQKKTLCANSLNSTAQQALVLI